jgi:hypothetical protein
MAVICFLAAFVLALIHWCGGTLLGPHYLDAFFTLLAAGLLAIALGWAVVVPGLPVAVGHRRTTTTTTE